MRMHLVDSTSIFAIGYNPYRHLLDIQFRTSENKPGEIYRYYDVPPEEHAAFMAAESKGAYLNKEFKAAGYRYERLK